MPDNALASLDYERYFRLLEITITEASSFAFCNCCDSFASAVTEHVSAGDICRKHNSTHDNTAHSATEEPGTCFLTGKDKSTYRAAVKNRNGDTVGYLLAGAGTDSTSSADRRMIPEKLARIASCLQEEYLLTRELNSMALELTGRYEELNLVYDTKDEFSEFSQDDDLLHMVVKNCVAYLDVDMVSLILPHHDRGFIATKRNSSIPDADDISTKLQASFYDNIKLTGKHILLNDLNSTQHRMICPDIPYKLLVSPVLNAGSEVIGMLTCLNQANRPDFFNSGRSVLNVMARKVSKIILTNYDNLTGLLSSRVFQSILARALSNTKLTGQTSVLLNIDLDQLKIVNDTYGRDAGDAAIQQLGECIKGKLRASDTIAYLGEGRFGVLVDKCDVSQGIAVAESLRKLIEEKELKWKSNVIALSASIGLAVIDPGIQDTDMILEAAEIARDTAKESGKNRIQIYHDSDKEIMMRKGQMRWVNRIQNALRDNRFIIYCQRILSLEALPEDYHFEILLRMIDEEGGTITPDNFITPAEQYHLMPVIDQWLITSTFRMLSGHGIAQTPGEGTVSINLSGQSMVDREIVDWISKQMHQYGIEPSCICFEVTETAAIRNIDAARHIIRELRSIGCLFSLDDFGTGMSSFSYLKELPVDYLKIDGSFIRKITEDRVAHAMVTSINDIGHVMGLKTIAEYVESEIILRHVKEIGTDYAQGYEIMKPAPLEQYLEDRLARRKSLQAG